MARQAMTAHYEVYALRSGRWVMDACFADEAEASDCAERVRRSHDVCGVRLVRELSLPGTPDPIVTVLQDSTRTKAGPMLDPTEAFAKAEPQRVRHQASSPGRHPSIRLDDTDAASFAEAAGRDRRLAYVVGASGLVMILAATTLALF